MYGGAAAEEAAVWGPEPPFSPSLAQSMAAWGVAPGPVFQSSSGRWASPRRAVFASLYTGVLCVRTLSAEPFWLSLCFDLFVHMVDVSGVAACAGVGGEIPSRCAHESTQRSLAVALQKLKITCRPVWGACVEYATYMPRRPPPHLL